MEDALRVKKMTTVELDLSSGMTDGETYSVMFYAQLRNDARGATFSGSPVITATDETGAVVAMGSFSALNQYIQVQPTALFTTASSNSKLTIAVSDYSGDVLLDHFLVAPASAWDLCVQKFRFDLTGKS